MEDNSVKLSLDTNIFIYFFDKKSTFYPAANAIFKDIAAKNKQIITSTITLTELLSFREASTKTVARLEEGIYSIPTLTIVDVNKIIAAKAARIRREYDFRLADSIQLATALDSKAQAFVTNDERLKKFKGIKVILLNEARQKED